MESQIKYEDVEGIVNYYFDKKEAAWKSRKAVDPISRDELKKAFEEFGLSDDKIIKIQREYLHLGSKINPIIVLDNGGCVLSADAGKREDVLNDIYMEFISNSGTLKSVELKKTYSIEAGSGEVFA